MARIIVAAIVMLLAASRPARADELTARLAFAGGACDRDSIERRVRELAQRDPFDPAAAWVVDVRIERRGDDVTAAVRLVDPDGFAHGERSVNAKSCTALSTSVALVIALALAQPLPAVDASPSAHEAPPPVEPPRAVDRTTRTPVESSQIVESAPVESPAGTVVSRRQARFGVLGGVTSNERGLPAALLGARYRSGARSISLELGVHAAESRSIAPGSIAVSRRELAAVPCHHFGAIAVCVPAVAGVFEGRGEDLPVTQSAATPFASVGGRLAWESQLARWVALRVHVEVDALVTRNHFLVDDMPVWSAGAVEAHGGMSFVANIP